MNFFKPGKWYTLNEDKRSEFINEATTINTAIAKFIGDRRFQVKLNDDENEVTHIKVELGDEWTSRTDAIPELKGASYGYSWFYSEDNEPEFNCFDEVDIPENNDKNVIVVLTEGDSDNDTGYWNGTRRAVGNANPTLFTMEEAKEVVKNFLEKSTDERAKAEIFVLNSTAQVVKEIKFS